MYKKNKNRNNNSIIYLFYHFSLKQMHSGSSLTPNNPAFSISIGIAALIIEGRPLFDDEYAADAIDEFHQPRHSTYANENQTVASAGKYTVAMSSG